MPDDLYARKTVCFARPCVKNASRGLADGGGAWVLIESVRVNKCIHAIHRRKRLA